MHLHLLDSTIHRLDKFQLKLKHFQNIIKITSKNNCNAHWNNTVKLHAHKSTKDFAVNARYNIARSVNKTIENRLYKNGVTHENKWSVIRAFYRATKL